MRTINLLNRSGISGGSRSGSSANCFLQTTLGYLMLATFVFLMLASANTVPLFSHSPLAVGRQSSTTFAPTPTPLATVSPALTESPVSGVVGTTITFSGVNYTMSSPVAVSWSGGTACTATTNTAGDFSCMFIIPEATAGGQKFTATDGAGGSASAAFTVIPQLTVTPSSGPAGTPATFSWTGYDGYCQYCGITTTITWMGGSVTACSSGNNNQGSASCTYTVPPGTPVGSYLFTGSDNTPHTATVTFVVTYTPKLTATPNSGVIGTTITFNGTRYAANSPVIVSWGGGTACAVTTSGTGSFTCQFLIPASTVGSHTFTGTDANSGSATATFTVIPQLIVSPTSGPAGTPVTFSWTGYDGYCQYCGISTTVTWMGGSVTVCSPSNDAQGSGSCTYAIPAGTPVSCYLFTGADNTPHTSTATFCVAYTPQLTAGPNAGVVGTTITFNGTSYATNSPIILSWSGGAACTATTNSAGSFSCTFTIPASAVGGHVFTGTDQNSGSAVAMFTVFPQLTIAPSSGPAGTPVTFSWTGYDGYCQYCGIATTVTWMGGSVTVCSVSNNAQGSGSCVYTIPAGTVVGSYLFTGADNTPHTATATFAVTYTPKLTATPNSGIVTANITFNGTDFAANSPITVSWVGGTACLATTNAGGSFSCQFAIPASTVGGHIFTGTDENSGSGTATFTIIPQLTVSPTSGVAGTGVTFSWTGYDGYCQYCGIATTVTWMGGSVTACSVGNSVQGSGSCIYTIPTGTSIGSYLFTGADNTPHTATTILVVVRPPQLTASPTSGVVGTTITISGTDFPADSSVTVNWNSSNTVACLTTTSALGSFTCNYLLPPTTAGNHTFSGTDNTASSATTTFRVTQQLILSQTSGPTGTPITFSATGFAGTSTIMITWSGGSACSGTTTIVGIFICTDTLQPTTAGAHTFTSTDSSSNLATGTFTVIPQLQTSPSSGPVGTLVTFAATGFAGSSTVTIRWSGGPACSATTSSTGASACGFVVPLTATPGPYQFSGTDTGANTADAQFILTNLSFIESGLPTGTSWSVSLNSAQLTSNSASISFSVPSGNYSYSVGSIPNFCTTTLSGTVAVTTSATMVPVLWIPCNYIVTFKESGLPNGLGWSVALGSSLKESTNSTVVFQLGNGTYDYAVAAVSGFTADSYTGSFAVAGSSLTINIVWTPTSASSTSSCPSGPYSVRFNETGLPGQTVWSVSVQGCPQASNTNSITFLLSSGSYVFTVTPVYNYTANLYTGSFSITGSPLNYLIKWSNATGIRGPPGPQGQQGPAGSQGPPGSTGAAGPTGAQGPQGSQGAAGQPGASGPQGVAGQPSATGAESSSGALIPYAAIAVAGLSIGISAAAILSSKRKRHLNTT